MIFYSIFCIQLNYYYHVFSNNIQGILQSSTIPMVVTPSILNLLLIRNVICILTAFAQTGIPLPYSVSFNRRGLIKSRIAEATMLTNHKSVISDNRKCYVLHSNYSIIRMNIHSFHIFYLEEFHTLKKICHKIWILLFATNLAYLLNQIMLYKMNYSYKKIL